LNLGSTPALSTTPPQGYRLEQDGEFKAGGAPLLTDEAEKLLRWLSPFTEHQETLQHEQQNNMQQRDEPSSSDEDEPRSLEPRFLSTSGHGGGASSTQGMYARSPSGSTAYSSAPTSIVSPRSGNSFTARPKQPLGAHARGGSGSVEDAGAGGKSGTGSRAHAESLTTSSDERADLTNWAPQNQLPIFGKQPEVQLPDFLASMNQSTSLALGPGQVQREMEESINGLLSETVSRAWSPREGRRCPAGITGS
jgi:hypothetical protein